MFQIWVYKQVTNIAGVYYVHAKYKKNQDTKCPSCGEDVETCARVINCKEEGRMKALAKLIQLVDEWTRKVGSHNTLRTCLVRYAKRGVVSKWRTYFGERT